MNALELKAVTLRVADLQIGADLNLAAGERLALFGPSGSGKTTLLRALAGLHPLTSGEIWCRGERIDSLVPEARGLGLVFQNQALFTRLSALENAVFGLLARDRAGRPRPTRADAFAKAADWLTKVGLKDRIKTPVERLSGGEAQRLALVRALIWDPALLLLDEPFSALDPATRSHTIELLQTLLAPRTIPVILVTHQKSDMHGWVDRALEITAFDQNSAALDRVCVDRMPSN